MSKPQQTVTIPQALDLAIQHHTKGELPEAESLYRMILQRDPTQVAAINMLGLIAHQVGKNSIAVDLISKALEMSPNLAEAHNNFGLTLRDLGRLDEAISSYERAISARPDYSDAHYNHGASLHERGKPSEAIICYHKALELEPKQVRTHLNLAYALRDLGRLEEAIKSYKDALTIDPNHSLARRNLGITYKDLGQLDNALNAFQAKDSPEFKAHALECLFTLGEYDRFYDTQAQSSDAYKSNLRAAAISAFASQQLGRPDPHPFCKRPLDFVRMYETIEGADQSDDFLDHIIGHLDNMDAVWEPLGKTTKGGFQSRAILFDEPTGHLAQLEQALRKQIEKYADEFAAEDCDYIQSFPRTLNLTGWFVRLVKGGHQTEHLHAVGWLSGVFYLRAPKTANPEEGAIELGLWGYDYPVLNNNYPKQRYYPEQGNLILFPSSLFHRTVPIHSAEDRLSIAFDLLPTEAP
jgi:uncharacterized protein (TIGR02466 family)